MADRKASSRPRFRWLRALAIAAGGVILAAVVVCAAVPSVSGAIGSIA
jgi:hypothetical protein